MAFPMGVVRCYASMPWARIQRASGSASKCQRFSKGKPRTFYIQSLAALVQAYTFYKSSMSYLYKRISLQRILLSCPTDESPILIVLPDFDIEAMSSVLYYIYNGEVVIKKENLDLFFDIIKTMQIFIDHKSSPKLKDYNEDYYLEFRKQLSENGKAANKNVFSLRYENCEDQRYVNIKKGQGIMDIMLQLYSPSDPGINDKHCQNWSEQRKANLGNLQPSYGDRQRNSCLRDLFIETYPRNGIVNGLTTSVLAISNECYRAPTSVLLTNANGKHLNNDALADRNTEQISHLPALHSSGKQLHCSKNVYQNRREMFPKNIENFSSCTCSENWLPKRNSFNMQTEPIPIHRTTAINVGRHEIMPFINFSTMQPDYLASHTISKSCRPLEDEDGSLYKLSGLAESSNINKATILNQVLDNPWNPRMPVNYKPFRKKMLDPEWSKRKMEQNKKDSDNNNNIETRRDNNDIINCTGPIPMLSTPLSLTNDDYRCAVCNQVYMSSESLAQHAKCHSTSARYSCSECGKTFSQLRNFKYHVSVHRGTREFAATCSVCGKYFNDRGYLSSHMKIHRNRKEYKCSLCPKSFNQRVAYNMHVRIHTGVKPHVCSECGKAFSRKMLLKQHQRTHSGERPYACPHCDKRFADRSNMTLHLRLHTGVKPFSCSLCPKSFTKKHHLKSHLNFHTGSKPYSCPRCQLAFTQSSNMRTHLKKCTAPGPAAGPSPQTQ